MATKKQIDVRGHCASILVEQNRLERRDSAMTVLLKEIQKDPACEAYKARIKALLGKGGDE